MSLHTAKSRFERLLPWGVSLLVHCGVALVLGLMVFQTAPDGPVSRDPSAGVPSSTLPRRVTPRPMRTTMANSESPVRPGEGASDTTGAGLERSLGIGASSESGGPPETAFSLEAESDRSVVPLSDEVRAGESATFFGVTSPAQDVVYVIDFSQSVGVSFDRVQREVTRSIGRLEENQRFHIILFSDGPPIEGRAGDLVAATRPAKRAAAEFLGGVQPEGRTEPIAALMRALDVLQTEDRRTKLLCLLTDGEFPDSAEVVQTIRVKNADSRVRVNTYLVGGSASSAATLRRIAEQNNGAFVRVDR